MIASANPTWAGLDEYASSLDAGADCKAAQIRPWLRARPSETVVDVGTAGGGVAAALSRALPDVNVVGTDACAPLVEIARERHAACAHVRFVRRLASEPAVDRSTAVILGAVLHEIFSEGGDLLAPVQRALGAAYRMLAPGGRLVIRDFVRPADAGRRVVFEHRDDDVQSGRSFAHFAARSPRRVPLDRERRLTGRAQYTTTLGAAYEYVFRKDAGRVWDDELAECYGFWTAETAISLVLHAGFDIVTVVSIPHRWIARNRLRGRVRIVDTHTGAPVRLPVRQLLLVAERPKNRWPS